MLTLTAFVLVTGIVGSSALELPKGWRPPTKTEAQSDDIRKESPSGYSEAIADFNGDGIEDQAFLLKSTTFSGEALWVRLSDKSKGFKWILLSEVNWGPEYPSVDLVMAIDVEKPGQVTYACYDEDKECEFGDRDQRPKLTLPNSSLVYFKPESAASLYFWSAERNRFIKVWLSD